MEPSELLCDEECIDALFLPSHSPASSKIEWVAECNVHEVPMATVEEVQNEFRSLALRQLKHWVGRDWHRYPHLDKGGSRALAVEWLHHLRTIHSLGWHTFGVAVNLLDRFLINSHAFPTSLLGLAATTAMMVAAKMEESSCPSFQAFLASCMGKFSRDTLAKMEVSLLQALRWEAMAITPYHFLDVMLAADAQSHGRMDGLQDVGLDLLRKELSTIVAAALANADFQAFPPSVIACGAVRAMARHNGHCMEGLEGVFYDFPVGEHRWEDIVACCSLIQSSIIPHHRRAQSPRSHYEARQEFEWCEKH